MSTAVKAERELGTVSEALKQIPTGAKSLDDASVRRELEDAPASHKKARTSVLKTDVFGTINPLFPVLLKKAEGHRMGVAQLISELDLILGMGDIRDTRSSVYVYAIQVAEPQDVGALLDRATLARVASPGSLIELMNGYIRHELLYDLPSSERDFILVNLFQRAKRLRVYLKPPWSAYKIECTVTISE